MNNEEILNSMIDDYKSFDEVEAIVLGGSSAAKTSDNKSDFDIYIYCTKEPPVEARRRIAEKYADNPEIDNHYFETGDVYYLRETGKPIDIMYRSPESIEGNIKWVWEECNASLGYTTCFVDNVNKSKILFDRNGWFKRLQDKTKSPYPDKLAQNIINKNLAFLASYFDIIFAKNKILHPGEKKLVDFAKANCKELPKNFEQDVNTLACGNVEERLKIAANMVEKLREFI